MRDFQNLVVAMKPVCWDSMSLLGCDNLAFWYSHNGVRTGKSGGLRIKGEKIDFKSPDLQYCKILIWKPKKAYAIKVYSKAMKFNIKIILHHSKSGGHEIYDLDRSVS